jgi:hypothetical protein
MYCILYFIYVFVRNDKIYMMCTFISVTVFYAMWRNKNKFNWNKKLQNIVFQCDIF